MILFCYEIIDRAGLHLKEFCPRQAALTVLVKRVSSENPLDLPFTMFELRKAISFTKQTMPGKVMVGYKMLANMMNGTLEILLRFQNRFWESGHLPIAWKHAIIVPVLGKRPF